jgi:hypothetical protein
MNKNNKNEIVIFTNDKGQVELRADIEKDTLWGTQEQIGRLFEVSSQNITMHLRNMFRTAELDKDSVCKESLHTGKDGKQYLTKFYNLDAIIAVGYRVNSKKATQFRVWATSTLREYLVKGYNLNKYSLQNSDEKFDDLHEAIAFMESKKEGEEIRGKMTIKLTKNLIRK